MSVIRWGLIGAIGAALAALAGTAAAQDASEAQLDALIDATQSDAGALAAARQQAAAGNLTGAAATLERSLLLRSGTDSDEVRLYYASVLCRLGDLRRGAYQMANVRDAAADGWEEARRDCAQARPIPVEARGDSISGILTLGVSEQSDARGALVVEYDYPLSPILNEPGGAVAATAAFDARFWSRPGGHGYAGLTGQLTRDFHGPDLDYQKVGGRLGYGFRLRGQDRELAIGAVARYVRVAGESWSNEAGVEVELSDAINGNDRWSVRLEAADQSFMAALYDPWRNGWHYDASFTFRRNQGLNRAWAAGAALEVKEAEWAPYGYQGGRVFGAIQLPLANGRNYASVSGVLRYIDYGDEPFTTDVREFRSYVRAAVGMPLNRTGLFGELAATHSGRWYNEEAGFRDYSSFGVEARLVYRFGHSWSPQ